MAVPGGVSLPVLSSSSPDSLCSKSDEHLTTHNNGVSIVTWLAHGQPPSRGIPGPSLELLKMETTGNRLAFIKVEIFTHHDPRTGRSRSWNATAMYNYAVRVQNKIALAMLDIEPHIVEMCRTQRGVEQWKLDRLREPFLSLPIVMAELEDRTWLMVDGNHRYVRRSEVGFTSIQAYLFAFDQWKPFLGA
jgi:hypothetical protein